LLGLLLALGLAIGLSTMLLPFKYILIALLGIAVFALIYWNIQIGFVLYVIFNMILPQAGPTIDLGIQVAEMGGETRGIHLNIHEVILAMILIAWAVKYARFPKWMFLILPLIPFLALWALLRAAVEEKSPLKIPVIMYVLFCILSCFVGLLRDAHPGIVAFRFIRTTFFVYIFFVVLSNIKTRRDFQRLVVIMLICATVVAAFGILQLILGQAWAEMVSEKYLGGWLGYPSAVNVVAGGEGVTQAYRVNSTLLHPNTLGAVLVLVMPFFISLLWIYRRWWMRILLLSGLALNLVCMFYTGSRAAWVGAGVVILIYALLGLLDRRIVLTVATVLIILILVMLIFFIKPQFLELRIFSSSAMGAVEVRLDQYRQAYDFFWEHPFLGLGMGMEGQRLIMETNNIRMLWAAVENFYLTYLVSYGIIGLTIFMLVWIFFWAMLAWARNNSQQDPFIRFDSEAFSMGLLGFAISAIFAAWLLFAVPMITMYWFFIGMGASLYELFRAEKEGLKKEA
jgi:putative inorganic carbon (HCO3(-)) transporter